MFSRYNKAKKEHPDIDEWSASTVFEEFGDDADAILAGSTCETSELPWEDDSVFEKVVLVLNHRPVMADIRQTLSTKEIAYAVKVLKEKYPEDTFNDVVTKYIAYTAAEEGFAVMPDVLSFAQRFLPVIRLSEEQESIQEMYLTEVEEYIAIRSTASLLFAVKGD
jgi:hypothetical protein